jgi:hypothetical protein
LGLTAVRIEHAHLDVCISAWQNEQNSVGADNTLSFTDQPGQHRTLFFREERALELIDQDEVVARTMTLDDPQFFHAFLLGWAMG